MPKPVEIQARVIGVWDDGDARIVEIIPGTSGGVAAGMKAVFPVVARYGASGSAVAHEIVSATDKVAVFKTRLGVDEIDSEVTVSAT